MNKAERVRRFEVFLYVAVLLVGMGMPFFTDAYSNGGMAMAARDWVRLLPFVLVFLVNNYLLVPKLLFRERYLLYFTLCIVLVAATVCLSDLLSDTIRSLRPNFDGGDFGPPAGPHFPGGGPRPGGRPKMINFGEAIVSFLLIGFNVGVKSFVRWSEERALQAEKERQYLHTELAFLKHQVSPHFFMNTLNNIHALVDIDAGRAKDAIIKLSRLMRYLLYEADLQKVSLRQEIGFMESYIELMRLRYDECNLTVRTVYPADADSICVPSFLFLSFIENAFKHGVDPDARSFINISFTVEDGLLVFTIVNSLSDITQGVAEASGIGLENVRKRLDLIYGGNYTLDIRQTEGTYQIILKIPI